MSHSRVNEQIGTAVGYLVSAQGTLCEYVCPENEQLIEFPDEINTEIIWMWDMSYCIGGIVVVMGTIAYLQKRKII
jgi:hypothetical protein